MRFRFTARVPRIGFFNRVDCFVGRLDW